MSAEPPNFEELQRLLALKGHETPPHQLMSQLTENIRDRLHHPQPSEPLTWWQRLRTDIDVKACALGVLACGLMLYAMLAAMGRPPYTAFPPEDDSQRPSPPTRPIVQAAPTLHPIPAAADIPPSTTPVIATGQTNLPAPAAPYKYWR